MSRPDSSSSQIALVGPCRSMLMLYAPIIVDLPPSSYHEWHSLVSDVRSVHYAPPSHHVGRPLSETCHSREFSHDSHIGTFSNADVVPCMMLPFGTSTVRFSCAPCAPATGPSCCFFRLRSLASRTDNFLVRKLGKLKSISGWLRSIMQCCSLDTVLPM